MNPAEGHAAVVFMLRKDAFVGAPKALGMDTCTYDKERKRKDYLFHNNS